MLLRCALLAVLEVVRHELPGAERAVVLEAVDDLPVRLGVPVGPAVSVVDVEAYKGPLVLDTRDDGPLWVDHDLAVVECLGLGGRVGQAGYAA